MSEPEQDVLDAGALRRLHELDPTGQARVVQRVLAAFEASVLRLAPQLEAASRSGDRNGIRNIAHTMKSSSASIGALRLSRLCADIEAMLREEEFTGFESRVERMRIELDVVLQALRPLLAAPP